MPSHPSAPRSTSTAILNDDNHHTLDVLKEPLSLRPDSDLVGVPPLPFCASESSDATLADFDHLSDSLHQPVIPPAESPYPIDSDSCPSCHGTGYITPSQPCLSCPGPQLTRFPTNYDGVGIKGSDTLDIPSGNSKSRVWIDTLNALIGTDVIISKEDQDQHDLPKKKKGLWSLKWTWGKKSNKTNAAAPPDVPHLSAGYRDDKDGYDSDNESLCEEVPIPPIVEKKKKGPRRSRRWNARRAEQEVESALKELGLKRQKEWMRVNPPVSASGTSNSAALTTAI
ncbi:hypothetical protein BC832DRAFT_591766 [Gaertneriomyces semiglobifer]|nr:hypothetical protein BC832DRAFT_591766 [Gaertneriomyces semiglobifer]